MAKTPSNMIPLGYKAPDFDLLNPTLEKHQSLDELKSSLATVIMFICNHCPFVIHINKKLADVAKTYQSKGISFIGINSNDYEQYPDDSPEKMIIQSEKCGYPFPYLLDKTQEVAKAYQAACTPDFYVFDKDLKCVYRGQFDDSRPGSNVAVTGKDLTNALDAILENKAVVEEQYPSMGCNIKWKKS